LVLGSKSTRNCGFCYMESAIPDTIEHEEPDRVAMTDKIRGNSIKWICLSLTG
jgi:lipoate synthase